MSPLTSVNPPLILASASVRRKYLLESLGVAFNSVSADVDESVLRSELPEKYVARLALLKTTTIAKSYADACVIGADTAVVLGDVILGKPEHAAVAKAMLGQLSGRSHWVLTAIVLLTPQGEIHRQIVKTKVNFASLNETEIDAYCATGEPFDKAGSYAIQGYGGRYVRSIEGSYSAVVGLPLYELSQWLQLEGYSCKFGVQT